MTTTYKVRDARTERRFFVDNVIIEHYGQVIGPYGIAVYSALCLHADLKTQTCFPGHETLASLLDCSISSIKKALSILAEYRLISIEHRYTEGKSGERKQTSNLYTILEPSEFGSVMGSLVDWGSDSDLRHMPYSDYLKTPHWKAARQAALKRAGWCCQECSASVKQIALHVHHLTYANRGSEEPEDLIALCADCHARTHHKEIQE